VRSTSEALGGWWSNLPGGVDAEAALLGRASGLVRVTVVAEGRRVDLAVPSAVPVAELLPGLARSVGLLDRATSCAGYRVVTSDGRILRTDAGLAGQSVAHGDLLAISSGIRDEPQPRHDDVAEAIALAVGDVAPWTRGMRRWATRGAAAALLLVGVPVAQSGHAGDIAVGFPAAVAGALVLAAAWLSRLRNDAATAVTVAQVACVYGGAAGLATAWPGSPCGTALALAGAGLAGTGVLAAAAMTSARTLVVPSVALGLALLMAGLVASGSGLSAAHLLSGLLVVTVLTSGAFPGIALGASGAGRHAWRVDDVVVDAAPGIDLERLSDDATRAREILVSLSLTAGVLLVVLAPVAVSLGPAGAAVPFLGCAVVMLRSRRHRAAADVLIGLASGVLGVAATVLSLMWWQAAWRTAVEMVVAVAGIVALVAGQREHRDLVRLGRLGDVAERAALGALVPALLVAVGLSLDRS
jgi:type VII secretion integral membrane protein EccD